MSINSAEGGGVPYYHFIILSLVSCPFWGGDTSPPSHNSSTGPRPLPEGGTPSPSHNSSTGLGPFWGGLPPSPRDQYLMGYPPPSHLPGQDRVLPPPPKGMKRMDGTWTGYAVGGTPSAVSRRRTFMLLVLFCFFGFFLTILYRVIRIRL